MPPEPDEDQELGEAEESQVCINHLPKLKWPEIHFDFPGLYFACSQTIIQPVTGLTVIYSPDRYMDYYISKRGGNTGGISLDPVFGIGYKGTKALTFTGGSTLGLEAVTGVNRWLLDKNIKMGLQYFDRSLGACIYTFNLVQGNWNFPDINLGHKALDNLFTNRLPIGQVGAGNGARVGKICHDYLTQAVPAGQTAAFEHEGQIKVLVIMVVNAMGIVHDKGKLLHCFYTNDEHIRETCQLEHVVGQKVNTNHTTAGNSTLTAVVTNVSLTKNELQTLGEDLHDRVAEMIYPYATDLDGDSLFMMSTGEHVRKDAERLVRQLGSKCITSAIKQLFSQTGSAG